MKAGLLLLLQYLSVIPVLPHHAWRLLRGWAWGFELWWTRMVYYRITVWRRAAAGEPLWKEVDLMIGIDPPPGHPYWDQVPKIVPLPSDVLLHGTSEDSESAS